MDEKVQKAIDSIVKTGKYVRGKLSHVSRLPYLPYAIWKEFAVPAIIENGGIPKSDLIVGYEYLGFIGDDNHLDYINGQRNYSNVHFRDTNVVRAEWTGRVFVYKYSFMGWTQLGEVLHFEDAPGPGVFVPCFK